MLPICAGLKAFILSAAGISDTCHLGGWERTQTSHGSSRTWSSRSVNRDRLTSSPLWIYLYAWPGIFPEQWLNTRWQRPLQPPLLRSGHGQCRAAPERSDLRRDRETNKESRWRHRVMRWGNEGRGAAKDRKYITVQGEKRRLFLALMIVLCRCHPSLLSHHAVEPPSYLSENNKKGEREEERQIFIL